MQDHKRIEALARRNPKATNEMLVALTAGVLAGNQDTTGEGAARVAADALERILTITEEQDVELVDIVVALQDEK